MATDGELGLKYRLDPSTGRITLFGADLGGPIYRVYDRATGALLNTLVIPPSRFINIGDIIDEKDFPTRTFSPIRFTIDNKEYTGIVVESAGASQEIISKFELPVATTGTTPAPSLGTTMPPTYDSPAVTNGIVTTPAPLLGTTIPPFPWQKPRDFGISWPTTPPPCDCIPGTIYLPDRLNLSSDGTIDGISDEDWNRFPPILWIPEGWGISLEDPREFPDYRPECYKEYIKGWEEFAPPGTGGIGTPGVAPTPQELEQLRYPPPPENAILGETRIYCRTDKIPSSSREEFSDPKGPWKCLPHEEEETPGAMDLKGMSRGIMGDVDRIMPPPSEAENAEKFADRLIVFGPPDEFNKITPHSEADKKLWEKMPAVQRDGWLQWRDRELERRRDYNEIANEQGELWDERARELKIDVDVLSDPFMAPNDEYSKIQEEIDDLMKPKIDEYEKKWGYNDDSFVPSPDTWAPPGWGWSPDKGYHQGYPGPRSAFPGVGLGTLPVPEREPIDDPFGLNN